MNKLKRIGLTNIVHFKETELTIRKGLHVIRGLNKSSKNKNQNNASGKSLLFSPLANIFVNGPPIQSKKKSKTELLSKNSCGYVELLTHDKKEIEIYQNYSSYDIFENGKDLKIATSTKAEKQIKEYFPLNLIEFYSTVYLTIQHHPFQVGSPSDRLKFISDLFRLQEYDVLKKHFSSKLRLIKDSETEHRALLTEYIKCEQQLLKVEWHDTKEENLKVMLKQFEDYSSQLTRLQDQSMEYSKMSVVHKQLKSLTAKLKKLGNIKNPKERKEKLEVLLEHCEEYVEYQKQYSNYTKTIASIQKSLNDIHTDVSVQEAEDKLKSVKRDYANVRKELDIYNTQKQKYIDLKKKRDAYKEKLKSFDFDIEEPENRSKLEKRLYAAESLLDLKDLITDKDCETVECPTCKSDYNVSELKKRFTKAREEYNYCSKQIKAVDCLIAYQAIVLPDYSSSEHNLLSESYTTLQKHYDKAMTVLESAKEKESLQRTLDSIKRPNPVAEPEYDIDDIRSKLNISIEYIRTKKEIQSLIEEHQYDQDFDESKFQTVKTKLSELGCKVNSLHTKIKSEENVRTQYNMLTANCIDIQEKLDALKESIDNKKIMEMLVNAYGPKGIKVNVINNLCKNLEQNFNNLAPFIYNEDFKFEIVVESSGIDVIVHRPKGFSSDIKFLSGAESDCFKLLFLTSMLPMLPSDRRVNVAILDEPDGHMDQVSRAKFINDFIPYLCSVVPSVYILTPNDDVYPDATSNLLVVKNKGVSILQNDDR